MRYTVNHFLKKFGKIPENKFCPQLHDRNGAHCYVGHCLHDWDEGEAFAGILWRGLGISPGELVYGEAEGYKQPSLKDRVLVALSDIKKGQKAVKQAKKIITNHKTLQHEVQC